MDYKFDDLYARLKKSSHTLGWGMMSFADDLKLGRLLLQLYIRRLKTTSAIPPISGSIPNGDQRFALNNFTLDSPRLDFTRQLPNDSRARLCMSVAGGTQLGLRKSSGDWQVREIRETSPLLGPELSLNLLLADVPGIVGGDGRVRLDLSKSSDFTLEVSDDPGMQRLVGEYFQQKFEALTDEQRVFTLGQIEAGGNALLQAKSFALRAQARGRDENDSAGGVLALIRYEGDEEGSYPGNDFSYLIPSDKDYDAAVLFDPKRIMLAQLLESLLTIAKDVEFEITRNDEGTPTGAVAKRGLMTFEEHVRTVKFQVEWSEWRDPLNMILDLKIFDIDFHMAEVLNVSLKGGDVVVEWVVKGVLAVEPQNLDDESGRFATLVSKFNFDTSDFYKRSQDDFEYIVTSTYRLEDDNGGTLKNIKFEMTEIKAPSPPVGEIIPPEWEGPPTDPEEYLMWLVAALILTGGFLLYIIFAVRLAIEALMKIVDQTQIPSVEAIVRGALEQNFKFTHSMKKLVQETIKLNFGNAIIGQDQYAPLDIGLFGNVNPAFTAFAIEPMKHTMAAGAAPMRFKTDKADTNLEWTIEPLLDTVFSSQIGHIDPEGLYTPPSADDFEGPFVRLRVVAKDKTSEFSSTALVTIMKNALQLNPLALVVQAKDKVSLQAGYLGDASALSWPQPEYGKVVGAGATAVYEAPEHMPPIDAANPTDLAAFTVDKVQVSAPGGDPAKTALLITESATKQPMLITRVVNPKEGTVQLGAVVNGRPQPVDKIKWKVEVGGGGVDPDTGVYSPGSSNDQFALITATYDTGIMGIYQGYVLQTLPPAALEDAVLGVGAFQVQQARNGVES